MKERIHELTRLIMDWMEVVRDEDETNLPFYEDIEEALEEIDRLVDGNE